MGVYRQGPTRRQAFAGAGAVFGLAMGGWGSAAVAARAGEPPRDPALLLTKFVDRLPIPPVIKPQRRGSLWELTIRMRVAQRRLHSELPPTRLWTYEGGFPGPTIDVERGQRVRVTWANQLATPFPVSAVQVSDEGLPADKPPANYPGRDGVEPIADVAALPAWAAVHLHGSRTGGGNDGWAENAVYPGDAQLSEYPNDQPAATLWYHDHAMHLTRFTVFSGLAGMYYIRDKEEAALGLPRGAHEIPLVLCDRNFDLGQDGKLDGRLLHKVILEREEPPSPGFFLGPYNLVNGMVWPYLDVEPRWYRFRVLNASNARTYRLMVLGQDGKPLSGALKVIGSDNGLLGAPAPVTGALTLAPAERADVLVDFSALGGSTLKLVDTYPGITPGEPNPRNGIPEPDIMQIKVSDGRPADRFTLPATISPSFDRLTHDDVPAEHGHRWIVVPPSATFSGQPNELGMWEMAEVDPSTVTIPSAGVVQVQGPDGKVKTLKRVAGEYADHSDFVIARGSWEAWNFLVLTRQPHPMHLHMVRFQTLNRDVYDRSGWNEEIRGTTAPIKFLREGPLEGHEQGWKDVVRVQGVELATVVGQFDQVGRYVYHCHILEHEMHMMRPFVVMPPEVLKLHPPGGGHH
ncbi:multicopper oxidase family protein [Nonomuraea basaltis]|uniref:multicopper oxidase family protein n=1 Tax=Nonomuraea basaltis TaxID=2495887 RepID=UPI001F107545|nr:multicopper oxidase domain-containing protein [Nonomuraea basaltis]